MAMRDPGPHPNPGILTSTRVSFATVHAMAFAACSWYSLRFGHGNLALLVRMATAATVPGRCDRDEPLARRHLEDVRLLGQVRLAVGRDTAV